MDDTLESSPFLFGGLALLPFAFLLLLTAITFDREWLNWETNGGVPFLGQVIAFMLYKLIQRYYYNRRYGYVFDFTQKNIEKGEFKVKSMLVFVFMVALLLAWYADAHTLLPVRLLALGAGGVLLMIAKNHAQQQNTVLSSGYLIAGTIMLLYGLLPLFLQVQANERHFGLEGVWELIASAMTIVIIALAEHHTITKIVLTVPSTTRG